MKTNDMASVTITDEEAYELRAQVTDVLEAVVPTITYTHGWYEKTQCWINIVTGTGSEAQVVLPRDKVGLLR